MRSQIIKEVALQLFSENGYEATSMAIIAEESGIKKASFYNHFKSKEELFFEIFQTSLKEELNYIQSYFQESSSFKVTLKQFLIDFLNRCEENPNAIFFMRTSFFPPANFRSEIKELMNRFIDSIEGILDNFFEIHRSQFNTSKEEAIMAYLTIFDGLLVESQYGEYNRLKKRQTYSWQTYWNGITK